MNSVCLHGHRAALRKAYFVHITVSLRHGKAYGKYSYAFSGVSDSVCVCQLLHLCVFGSVCFVNMTICAQVHFVNSPVCVSVVWAFQVNIQSAKHVKKAVATRHPPSIPFLSPLSPLSGSVTQLGSDYYWGCLISSSCWGK